MKYWLYDGNDVIGPFALQELAARSDFSAHSLICAEDSSEDSAGWQLASFFDTFRFDATSGKLECVILPDGSSATVPLAPAKQTTHALPASVAKSSQPQKGFVEKDVTERPPLWRHRPKPTAEPNFVSSQFQERPYKQKTAYPSFIKLSKLKEPSTPPAPIALAQEDLELILPTKSTVTVTSASKTGETVSQPITIQPAAGTQAPKPETTPVNPAVEAHKETEPETEIISTCTLPIINEILNQSELPRLPEGEFPPVALSADPSFDFKTFSEAEDPTSVTEQPLPEDQALPQNSQGTAIPAQYASVQLEETKSDSVAAFEPETNIEGDSLPGTEEFAQDRSLDEDQPEELVHPTPKEPVKVVYPEVSRPSRKSISEIEKQFSAYSAQGEMLVAQQLLAKRDSKKAQWMLVLLILLLMGAVVIGIYPHWKRRGHFRLVEKRQNTTVQEEILPDENPASSSSSSPVATRSAFVPASLPIVPVSAADKALSAVQNYSLPKNRGTIASYFDRVYQAHLSHGYTSSWKSEPLHKDTYIVKYRLTKPRTEPIVYVFQADAQKGKLTGALNNAALDLVGEI
ncbi:MAG: hypothetical protein IKP96_06395 [Elusimicrobiaceae bacterium]|nr:hypothetical protein [Elusimicrobiaceae bacterium]